MSPFSNIPLRTILAIDAATCLGMGAALALGSGPIAGLTGLPPNLLLWAGLVLLPTAVFIAIVARRPFGWGVRAVVLGNVLWVGASLLVLAGASGANALGVAFVLAQAAVVAVFAWCEAAGGRAEVQALAG
ncbi:MAG: hypothetical protein AVDCRST_MAG90-858 [uncultured Microvirga sp.]|uniref:Integral membrane protein n=1 Tax=uncultured Microvirga sp. TaxID=412392 RepID=A0A6J4KZC5_9HYPH|nr:MAG: hypothetical protein AVDCRST_MAG90-858 [uncultured Microvirga sp.]